MSTKEIICTILEREEISASSFAKSIGITPTQIYDLQSGKIKRISGNISNKIISIYPHYNISWLLTGEGEMLKKAEESTVTAIGVASKVMSENAIMVKFFDVNPSATFQELDESVSQGYDTIEVVPIHGERIDDSYVVFEIHGDSMAPTLLSHARILCKEIPEQRWQYAEGVVVISYKDKVVVKRIVLNDILGNSMIELKSDNPDYGSENVQLSDIHCIYKAKRIISQDIF